jgi:single-stranded-DNA-specific exonuclease
MNRAVARIRQAIRAEEPIAVYGDFDTDGVTATALLVQALRALNAVVEPYIPHREEDGYGLNSSALMQMAQDGFRLVITVDCGIRSMQEVLDASAVGLDLIITDHHSVGVDLPDALAVVNPKRADNKYPETMLAGVGGLRLADACFARRDRLASRSEFALEDLVDLVAVGTLADLAPPNSLENRVGYPRKTALMCTPAGLYALFVEAHCGRQAQAVNIGFGLGPRLNAAGRLEHASTAYELLTTDDFDQARSLASELQEINVRRQDEPRLSEIVARELAFRGLEGVDPPMLFAADESFLPGDCGLRQGGWRRNFYRQPCGRINRATGECRGSCGASGVRHLHASISVRT